MLSSRVAKIYKPRSSQPCGGDRKVCRHISSSYFPLISYCTSHRTHQTRLVIPLPSPNLIFTMHQHHVITQTKTLNHLLFLALLSHTFHSCSLIMCQFFYQIISQLQHFFFNPCHCLAQHPLNYCNNVQTGLCASMFTSATLSSTPLP